MIRCDVNFCNVHVHRYNEYAEDADGAPNRVVPDPLSISLQWDTPVQTDNFWKIVNMEVETENEAIYFAGKFTDVTVMDTSRSDNTGHKL